MYIKSESFGIRASLTFLRRELVHAIWLYIPGDNFMQAYTVTCIHGIEFRILDGIT